VLSINNSAKRWGVWSTISAVQLILTNRDFVSESI